MTRALLIAAAIATPTTGAMAADGELSQLRNAPFSDFDLTAIGIALVVVMVVLGFRALKRRRHDR